MAMKNGREARVGDEEAKEEEEENKERGRCAVWILCS